MRPPTLGAGRLVCVDGPAGAGKTTLGSAVLAAAARHGTARLLHVDDLLTGWDGLPRLSATIRDGLLTPLAAGEPGEYRRYDWERGAPAEQHRVPPVDTLVIEGVGCWSPSYAHAVTTLVWVDAPRELRLARGLSRDGEAMRGRWLTWLADEEAHFARQRTAEHADILVDATDGTDRPVVLR